MEKISTEELNSLFIDTINRCTYKLIYEKDDEIEYQLFEEFDIGATSFLHEYSLNKLLKKKFINNEIKKLSIKLRKLYFEICEDDNYRNSESVRTNKKWHELLELSDTIREKKSEFDLKMS